jgi:5-methylcytosine-specific restriction endonuclease McrA
MKKVLLLNSDWTPLNFISELRAFTLIDKGRCEVITITETPSIWDEKITTPQRDYDSPATLRVLDRVHRRYASSRFRKKVLFNRDNWQCQYCNIKLDKISVTIDHVIPRTLGGQTSWKNCVVACKKCNLKKGSKSLSETGMKLRKQPIIPTVSNYWEAGNQSTWHPDWIYFLGSNSY